MAAVELEASEGDIVHVTLNRPNRSTAMFRSLIDAPGEFADALIGAESSGATQAVRGFGTGAVLRMLLPIAAPDLPC